MATNSKVFVSPGVYTSEVDLSFVAQSVGVTTLGVVGETLKGPAFEPIFVRNFDEFQTYFGGTSPTKFINTQIPKYEAAYIAKSYLQQSNQLFVTRILGLSGYDAGPSWSIKTVANVDPATIDVWCLSGETFLCDFNCTSAYTSDFVVNFTGCTESQDTIVYESFFPTVIQNIIDEQNQQFDGSSVTLNEGIKDLIFNVITDADPTMAEDEYISIFGSVDGADYSGVTALGFTAQTNFFDVPNVVFTANTLSNSANDPWFYALFDPTGNGNYTGYSFWSIVQGVQSITPSTLVGPLSNVLTLTSSQAPGSFLLSARIAPGSVVVEFCLIGLTPVPSDITLTFDVTLGVSSGLPIVFSDSVTILDGAISGCSYVTLPDEDYGRLNGMASISNLVSSDPLILDPNSITFEYDFICEPIVPTPTVTPVPPDNNLCYSGSVVGKIYYYTGNTFTDYDDVVVATLRSRGIATYADSNVPTYEVTGLTDVSLTMTGAYSAVTKDPYATFLVNATNSGGVNFSFETSFSTSDAEYVSKVFGTSNFAKPKATVPLFLEERFQAFLNYAYKKGYIRGLSSDLIALDSAQSESTTSIGWYLDRYQTPSSPWVVSELRGNKVFDLFKFYTVADGNSANTNVKVSIFDISFANGTFSVLVRDYFDSDANPTVLEKFTNCSMDPSQNNFVAKKIGTLDGEYQLNSKFIMVEMNEDAPVDALPCGFDGYTFREYAGAKPPYPIYKTKYNFPGEVIWNPPFGLSTGGDNTTLSSGDNVRRTYLGFSNQLGYDSDFFEYVGKQNPLTSCDLDGSNWNYKTRGFHMDKNASGITINGNFVSSGDPRFFVGDATFSTEPTNDTSPYYRLFSRKYTLFVQGGFDGWDIYREYRTNGDRYVLGRTGFLNGACATDRYPTATGWGAFKQISVGDGTRDYGNTDYYAYLLGVRTFANPEAVNINVFATPGIDYVNNSDLVEATIDMIEYERADSLYITTSPDYNLFLPTTTGTDGLIYPQEAVDNLEETGIDSNYTATYYPWVLTRDSVNNTQIYIPATAEVTRNLALTDNIAFPWFAAAGYTRGLVNAIKARKKLTQEDRDTLYQGRINPIATFSDVGTVIWGNKTLQIRESALDRINVRRLLLQARKLISAVSVRLLFDQNDEQVRQDFLNAVNPILDSIRRDRGLYDFRVTVSSDTADLDRNQMTGKIYIKPTRSLEFIDITFYITPTGASFEDI